MEWNVLRCLGWLNGYSDTRYTFDNTDDKFTPRDSGSIFYNVIYAGKKIRFSEGFYGHGYYPQSVMIIKNVKWNYNVQRCYIFCQEFPLLRP